MVTTCEKYDMAIDQFMEDRKSVVQGKSVDLGGRRIIKKKKHKNQKVQYNQQQHKTR